MTDIPEEVFFPWVHDKKAKTIENKQFSYWIDLDCCRTSAEVLDWIIQISKKTWADDECLANLVRCLDEVLDLQGNYCGGGTEKNQ